ncbi:MAG: prolyl oligopeptidase family serine peptidase [Woeseia sp.]
MNKNTNPLKSFSACALLAALFTGNTFWPEASATAELSLDSLYSAPSLLGTPPELVEWSDDGMRIAFLWNDQGYRNCDIWLFSLATGEKRQLTTHIDEANKHAQKSISEIRWLNNQQIVYLFEGDLYAVDLDGNSKALEARENAIEQLSVSPDGKYLSFVTDGDLWVSNAGEAKENARRLLKSGSKKIFVESYKWSTNGKSIAMVMADNTAVPDLDIHYFAQGNPQLLSVTRPFPGDETTKRRIGLLKVSDTGQTWLNRRDEKRPIWGYDWSPDSQSVFVDSSDFLAKNRTIFVYDATTAEQETFYSSHDPNRTYPGWAAAWAPDGNGLIVLSDDEGYYHLYHVPEAGSTPVPLTSGTWEVASFSVDSKNSQIYFIGNKDHIADRQLYRVELSPKANIERISTESGTYEPFYSPDFRQVAFRFSNDQTPPDLYHKSLRRSENALRITESQQDDFYSYTWADVRYVEFDSHVDGAPLVGRLYVPKNFDDTRCYPVIVGSVYRDTVRNQWGGSQNAGGQAPHPTWGLDQLLVSKGYLVFNVDVRSSWGHGKAFRNDLDEYGGIDVDDIESGVRYLVSRGFADPERVGIWGLSYGGLLTTMSLFKKPGVYAAGIAGAPATNVWHAFPQQMWVMGEPAGDDYPSRYERQSPFFQAEGLEDPLMIVHGTRDNVVLYSDSIALAEKLIANGKTFELVTLPGANHPWASENVEQTRFAFGKIVEFFDRHLKE